MMEASDARKRKRGLPWVQTPTYAAPMDAPELFSAENSTKNRDNAHKVSRRKHTKEFPFEVVTRASMAAPAGPAVPTTTAFGDMPTPLPDASDQDVVSTIRPSISAEAKDPFHTWEVGDRYRMTRPLGHGSYGEVAEAIDTQTGQRVAIKRIQHIFDQLVDAKRIYREIFILRRLKNPQVVDLLDVVVPDGRRRMRDLYLVFEFVDTDLYKLILSAQYLTTPHVQTFLYQILVGLKFMHSANVVHRDVKPANILLNEDCSLKICDFGLSRVMHTANTAFHDSQPDPGDVLLRAASSPVPQPRQLTRQLTKHVVTRWYRAPELILLQDYTSAVDVWSAGCIFAELLGMQRENIGNFQDRTPLFPGKSCYPLSVDNADLTADESTQFDQLSVIFEVIGSPDEDDIETFEDEKVRAYLSQLQPVAPRLFRSMFPGADPRAEDLLTRMLQFNPAKRISVDDALEHPFLADVRNAEAENNANAPVSLDVEEVAIEENALRDRILYEVLQLNEERRLLSLSQEDAKSDGTL